MGHCMGFVDKLCLARGCAGGTVTTYSNFEASGKGAQNKREDSSILAREPCLNFCWVLRAGAHPNGP